MDSEVFLFFVDELEKLASDDSRKRHNYYMQNRNRILQQQQQYRAKNRAQIARRQKAYRRKVGSGQHRQRQRIGMGNSYTYGGYR
jgi:hypothetical protein